MKQIIWKSEELVLHRIKGLVYANSDTSVIKLTLSEEGYGPSDHSSFYGKNIPVLFYFTGAHMDYHTPTDTWEKINFKGMVEISDLVFNVAKELAWRLQC
jgi:Zn-dependent M28 family amino/carboxypeptidase